MARRFTVPEWLNEGFVERALRQGEKNDSIKVKQMTVQPGTSPGDNYCSDAYRITVEYETRSLDELQICKKSLFMKIAQINDDPGFTTENEALGKVVPLIHSVLNADNPDEPIIVAAKCYMTSDKPTQLIVLEDLSQSGFKMVPKKYGLDLDYCKFVVSKHAVLHAASVALHLKTPNVFDNLRTPIYARKGETVEKFFTDSCISVAEEVQSWPDGGPRYAEKLRKLCKTGLQRTIDSFRIDEQAFNVMTHGDSWSNNMLFKLSENGELSDLAFVDFQFTCYCSPVMDLLYLFYTSATSEVRSNHLEDLLQCYHTSLSKNLTKLGCGRLCPSLEDIRREFEKRSFLGVYALICLMPYLTLDPNKPVISTDGETGFQCCPQHSEEYCSELKRLLPIFEKKGLLD